MSAKNGKPCKKCGSNEWYKNGNCAPCAREMSLKWQRKNLDKVRVNNAKWQRNNPDKVKEKNKKWRRENPDKVRGRTSRWQRENPSKANEKTRRYQSRKAIAGGSYSADEWEALVEHYGNRCLCCGRTDVKIVVDHVVPVTKGGSSNIDNIQPLCQSCNSRKGTKTIDYR